LPVAIRALNPKDPAFGLIANALAPEIEKKLQEVVKSSSKKKTTKKTDK
jgi:hypothetical protein